MGYCIFRNISENKASLWIAVFSEIFPKIQQPYRVLYFAKYLSKYSLPFLLTFNRSIDFNRISHSIDFTHVWSELFKKHAERNTQYKHLINPCFTNCCFPKQYSNYKINFVLLKLYYEVKILHIIFFFCIHCMYVCM